MGMLAGVTDCRRSRKWGCRGSLVWGFNPGGVPAIPGRGPRGFGREGGRGPQGFGGVGGENQDTLAEWGPHGGNTADSAGSLNPGLLLLFLRYSTPDWAEGEGRTVCICGFSKGL